MTIVTVLFVLDPSQREEFMPAMREQARRSLERESGCQQFDICIAEHDPCQVFLYEVYSDQAAFDAHLDTPHYRDFAERVAPWVREKTVSTWFREECGA
jgi:quinol monooxygenase YgiN